MCQTQVTIPEQKLGLKGLIVNGGYLPITIKIQTSWGWAGPSYKHVSRGNKLSNSLLTKFRVGRSDLNLHKFTIGLIDSPQCDCLFREESSSHYFLDCFLYSPERRILFDLIEHYIPKFSSFKKSQKLDIILRGFEIENIEFIGLNTTLTLAVQKFIMQTKRFYVPSSPL